MTEGVVALWIAGEEAAQRAERAGRRARLPGGPARERPLRPRRPAARQARAAGRQVDLAPRGDHRRDGLRAGADQQLPRRRRHRLDARRGAASSGAIVERRDGEVLIRGGGLRNAQPPGGPIDVGNAGTLMRLLPGWLAFQQGASFTLDGDESIRRRPGRPDRRAAARRWARGSRRREGRFPPFTVHGAPLHGDRLRAAGGQRPGQVVRAAGRAGHRRHDRDRAGAAAATTPSGCCCGAGRRADPQGAPDGGLPTTVGNADELELEPRDRPRRHVQRRVPDRRRRARAAARAWCSSASASTGRGPGFLRIVAADGGDRASASSRRRGALAAERADLRPRRQPRPARGHRPSRPTRSRWRSTSCRWWRCWAASPRARRSSAARRSCASRSPTGSPPWSTACAGSAPTSRRSRTASSCAAPAGCAAGGSTPTATTGWRCSGAVAGLASQEGVEVVGMEAAEVSYPGFADDLAGLARLMVVAIDGPAGAGKSTRGPGRGRRARLHLPGLGRDVPLRRAGGAASAGRRRPSGAAELRIELGERVRLDGADVTEEIRAPRGLRGGLAGGRRPRACARRWSPSSAGCWPAGTGWPRGATSAPWSRPDAEVKVFLTADPEERARRRAAELGVDDADGPGRAGDPRPARHHAASTRRWRRPRARCARHHRPHLGRGRGADRRPRRAADSFEFSSRQRSEFAQVLRRRAVSGCHGRGSRPRSLSARTRRESMSSTSFRVACAALAVVVAGRL